MPSIDIQESIVSTIMSLQIWLFFFFSSSDCYTEYEWRRGQAIIIQLAEIMPLHILPFLTAQSMNLNHERMDESGVPGWCKCGQCVQMKNQEERVCCGKLWVAVSLKTQHLLTCA